MRQTEKSEGWWRKIGCPSSENVKQPSAEMGSSGVRVRGALSSSRIRGKEGDLIWSTGGLDGRGRSRCAQQEANCSLVNRLLFTELVFFQG